MKKNLIALLILAITSACSSPKDEVLSKLPEGEYEKLMQMTYKEFDQTQNEGWRKYRDDHDLQVRLLHDYIEKNKAPEQSLRWHLGQIYGMKNDNDNAIKFFEQCYYDDVAESPGKRAWNYYVGGSIAFIKKDVATFDKYLDSLQNNDNQMNMNVMQRLKENFGKPYSQAY